ncbi:uncharacterized protein B0H18DRAFT_869423 [Fomitopsis serialis]|uniref:uncharacterized protein n=1 Tax=Fomitopsis serialis TaxID=139415 RepID=UPI002007206A|nr:uncharacterized protein B0H18DRAFT_869423 [Neoantrodia serialis]KAH9934621.1 hypothetical protein B0H18DRAFT_869423 [Neoantrodia serialis]
MAALPAHSTKHIALLRYPFHGHLFYLAQRDNGLTNGTALWLGAQCLSLFLADALRRQAPPGRRLRAIELGSGIGLSALALCSMGWDVLATDLPDVISAVLSSNVARNTSQLPVGSGTVQVRALDWTVPPDQWVWDNATFIGLPEGPEADHPDLVETLRPPFDLIISSDTLYATEIVQPLFRTLHALTTLSAKHGCRSPPVYLAIERRDPLLIDLALADAVRLWDFTAERVPHKKIVKALEKGGANWDKEDWDDVEIWKLTRKTDS